MKKITRHLNLFFLLLVFAACDKRTKDLLTPLSSNNFPQVIVLADEGDGDLEDEDKFSFNITLLDRVDPDGEEHGGKITPLEQDLTVQFAITGFEGFPQLADYILGAEAFYEIDDCTNSLDIGIDLNLQFDAATGLGSVRFPAGVEEIEIEFETDNALFDDGIVNSDDRSITIRLTGISGAAAGIDINKTASFTYEVLDDEGIYGEWELDVNNADAFTKFKALFGLLNEDIANLSAGEVSEILLVFEYGEVKAIVVLKETEIIDDCGTPSDENKVIEIEAELEELDDRALNGAVEFGETLEPENGIFREFVYAGSFTITGSQLSITLEGEFGDNTTDEITLVLDK